MTHIFEAHPLLASDYYQDFDQHDLDYADYLGDRVFEQMRNDAIYGSGYINDDYDHFTSDYDYQDECDAYDALCPFALESDWIDTVGNLGHKLHKFMSEHNNYKKYDPDYMHPRVANQMHWDEPIHLYPCNKGFTNAYKKITGLIRKHEVEDIATICDKIKKHVDYKTNYAYRDLANKFIDALRNPGAQRKWSSILSPYEVTECGHLFIRDQPVKYYFPYNAYEDFKTETLKRFKSILGHCKGVTIFANNDFESLVVVQHKVGKRKTTHKIYTKSMFDLFDKKDQLEWAYEIRNSIIGE